MYTEIDENVRVEASFAGEKITPLRFIWNGRSIRIRQITQRWEERGGPGKTIHFAACDGQSVFSLSFDSASLLWKLEGISDGL